MNKLVKIAAAGVVAAAMSSGAYAVDITIDTLTIFGIASQDGVGSSSSTQASGGTEIWDERTLIVNVASSADSSLGANEITANGEFSFSADATVDATYQIAYNGLFDITNGQVGGVLRIISSGTDVGGVNIDYTLTDNAANTATTSVFAPQAAATIDASLSAFSGIDLQNLASLVIFIDPVADSAADGTFTLIGTADFEADPVPAPAAITLLTLGLLGMRRLRK